MDERRNIGWPGWTAVRLLGRGSFGAVYEIERDVLGETERAAMKYIRIPRNNSDIEELYADGMDSESITDTYKNHLKNIVSEYYLMKKMNGSANVVNCDDVRYVQHADGIGWDIYIKMELLTPLTRALPGEIPEGLVIKLAKDMCNALILCRKYNIIHRDIKPQNIFVSANGDFKLGDFGIAKTVEKTSGGTKTGTYKYMAPEVYHNQPYGTAADIYSLGLVLYWMLNERRMPFMPLPPKKIAAGMDEQARLRRFRGEAIPLPEHGSYALKKIVLKACEYDPRNRYRSAQEMLNDLMAINGEIPVKTAAEGWIDYTAVYNEEEKDTELWEEAYARSFSPQQSYSPQPINAPRQQYAAPVQTPVYQPVKTQKPVGGMRPWHVVLIVLAAVLATVAVVLALLGNRREPAPVVTPKPTSAYVVPTAQPTPQPTEAPEPTPIPTQRPVEYRTESSICPGDPSTNYGFAVRNEYIGYKSYTLEEKVGIIGNQYADRKDANGKYWPHQRSASNKENETGYRLGFYYADEMAYYAEVLSDDGKTIYVQLYYWGDCLIAVRDKRIEDDDLAYPGSSIFNNVAAEFAAVYDISLVS